MFDLEKTKKYLIKICDNFKKIEKEENSVYWWCRGNNTIALDKIDYTCYKNAINEIRKEESVKINFDIKYIEDMVKDILMKCLMETQDKRAACIEHGLNVFNLEIKGEIKKYFFSVPVYNIEIEEGFSIGEVNFYLLDDKKIDEIDALFNINDNEFREHIKKDFIEPNKNWHYAESWGRGTEKYAYYLALNKIRMAINILKLYSHEKEPPVGLVGETLTPASRTIFIYSKDKGHPRWQLVGSHDKFRVNKRKLEYMYKNDLDELNRILTDPKQTDFETRLLNGIYWFGESVNIPILDEKDKIYVEREKTHENLEYFNLGEKFIKLFISLESVLTDDNERNKTKNISERGSKLLSQDVDIIEEIKSNLKSLYWVRGEIVHRGDAFVSKYELSYLNIQTKTILFRLIELNKKNKFENVKDLIRYINNLSSEKI